MTEQIVVFTTTGSDEQAQMIASILVEKRLAACVSIVPSVLSVYRWKGKQCREAENLLIIKTSARLFEKLKKTLRQIHPYEVPEIIALPVKGADEDYLRWLKGSLLKELPAKKIRLKKGIS